MDEEHKKIIDIIKLSLAIIRVVGKEQIHCIQGLSRAKQT